MALGFLEGLFLILVLIIVRAVIDILPMSWNVAVSHPHGFFFSVPPTIILARGEPA